MSTALLNRQDAKNAKQSEATTNQTESVKATTLQKVRAFSCLSWLKIFSDTV
jgi:hypothetical protein